MAVKVQQVLEILEQIAPPELACSWDNVGLLVDAGRPVTSIMTALDITADVVRDAAESGCELIVSHHPVIFDPLRRVTADIVFKTYSGLSIEPQALYYVDGSAGVYVREGVRARFKKVNILYEYDGGYVVELDTSSTSNLWPEDEIILTSDDIYAGKVFE